MEQTLKPAATDAVRSEPFSIPIDSIKGDRFQVAQVKNQILDKVQSEGGMVTTTTAKSIQDMLKGRRSDLTVMNDMSVGKLYITNAPNKGPQVQQINPAVNLSIPQKHHGHTFTPADVENLQRFGNMGRRVELTSQKGKAYPAFIGVDKDLKQLVVLPANKFRIPDTVKGVPLSPKQKEMLAEGKAIRLFDMVSAKGNFAAYVRIDAAKESLRFDGIDNNKKAAFQKKVPAPVPALATALKTESVKKPITKKPAQTAAPVNTAKAGQIKAPRAEKITTAPKEAPRAKAATVAKPNKSKGMKM